MTVQLEISDVSREELVGYSTGKTVYSSQRTIVSPRIDLTSELALNARLKMEGLSFLSKIPSNSIPVVFFDPQYRGVLDKLKFGNEGKSRGKERSHLPQMSDQIIKEFVGQIDRTLIPSGHLFLWIDKFHLCQGISEWLVNTDLEIVDMITWNKQRMGMGYRSRRCSEYLTVLQTYPRKAKGIWKVHNIRDVWDEQICSKKSHTHQKPVSLQQELIRAVSNEGDVIVDPAAGSFSVMESAHKANRNFLGCDING